MLANSFYNVKRSHILYYMDILKAIIIDIEILSCSVSDSYNQNINLASIWNVILDNAFLLNYHYPNANTDFIYSSLLTLRYDTLINQDVHKSALKDIIKRAQFVLSQFNPDELHEPEITKHIQPANTIFDNPCLFWLIFAVILLLWFGRIS